MADGSDFGVSLMLCYWLGLIWWQVKRIADHVCKQEQPRV